MMFSSDQSKKYVRFAFRSTLVDAQGLRPLNGPDGALIQYSSSTDHHNLFTKSLLENIAENDIHVADMFRKVAAMVWRESDGTQRPVTMNKLEQFRPVYLNEDRFGRYSG